MHLVAIRSLLLKYGIRIDVAGAVVRAQSNAGWKVPVVEEDIRGISFE